MGQYWLLAAPRRRERWADAGGKLAEFLFTGIPSGITPLLIRPIADPARIDDGMSSKLKPEKSVTRNADTTQLMDLPTEIHDKIFSYAEFLDILSLCLTSQHFFLVGVRHVKAGVARSIGPWAGEPIICIGDYAETLPEVLLKSNDDEVETDDETDEETDLYCRALHYRKVSNSHSLLPRFRDHAKYNYIRHELVQQNSSASGCYDYLSSIYRIVPDLYPKHPWVLRNLTTKEYVREEFIQPLSLGDVVCCRICWSDDPSSALSYDGKIHRGVWAGHRFEVVGSDVMEKEKDGGWKDMSESVMKELDAIWSSDCGPNWRKLRLRWLRSSK